VLKLYLLSPLPKVYWSWKFAAIHKQTPEFNVLTSSLKGSNVLNKRRTVTGTRKHFWPDALYAATNDSYGYQRKLNDTHTIFWIIVYTDTHACTHTDNNENNITPLPVVRGIITKALPTLTLHVSATSRLIMECNNELKSGVFACSYWSCSSITYKCLTAVQFLSVKNHEISLETIKSVHSLKMQMGQILW